MDLELSDEQVWIEESVDTLLERQWPPAETAWQAGEVERARLWESLVEFGVLSGAADGQLGAIELCLVARALGAHLGSAPFLGSVGVRYALAPFAAELPAGFAALLGGDSRLGVALLEPGGGWSMSDTRATVDSGRLTGTKTAVEHALDVDYLAVVARGGSEPVLALVPGVSPGIEVTPAPGLDVTVPLSRVGFVDATAEMIAGDELGEAIIERLITVAGLLSRRRGGRRGGRGVRPGA